jgi:hypothetical protein
MGAYSKNLGRSQIDDIMLLLKLLDKQEQVKPKASRRRGIIKIRAKINEVDTRKPIQTIKETKSWFFEKMNKIDKPMENLTKMRREKTQISKIRNKKCKIKTNTKEIRESSETTLRIYIEINWKMSKKWTNF